MYPNLGEENTGLIERDDDISFWNEPYDVFEAFLRVSTYSY
jgi:hypothetical protein